MLGVYFADNFITLGIFAFVSVIHIAQAYVINAIVPIQPRTITCWRCQNKTDNSQCNYWTEQHKCPTNYSVCQTIHRINVETGQILQMSKRCALSSECTMDLIGCHDTHITGIQDCISCCNYAYCNEYVPSNYSSAQQYTVVESSASVLHSNTVFFPLLFELLCFHFLHFFFVRKR